MLYSALDHPLFMGIGILQPPITQMQTINNKSYERQYHISITNRTIEAGFVEPFHATHQHLFLLRTANPTGVLWKNSG